MARGPSFEPMQGRKKPEEVFRLKSSHATSAEIYRFTILSLRSKTASPNHAMLAVAQLCLEVVIGLHHARAVAPSGDDSRALRQTGSLIVWDGLHDMMRGTNRKGLRALDEDANATQFDSQIFAICWSCRLQCMTACSSSVSPQIAC